MGVAARLPLNVFEKGLYMNYFNVKNLDFDSALGAKYCELSKSYNKGSSPKAVNCYIEEYKNEYNMRSFRLRTRSENKIIKFWVSPSDPNRYLIYREIKEFLEKAKRDFWNTGLFQKDGDFSVLIEGQFGDISDNPDELEVITYFCRCFFFDGLNTVYEEDTNGLCKVN